jgi:hypothetical protein
MDNPRIPEKCWEIGIGKSGGVGAVAVLNNNNNNNNTFYNFALTG